MKNLQSKLAAFIAENRDTYCYGEDFKNYPEQQALLLKVATDEFLLDYCVEGLADVRAENYVYPYATYYCKALGNIVLIEDFKIQETPEALAEYAVHIQEKCEDLEKKLETFKN